MKELYDFNKALGEMNESKETNDLGGHWNLKDKDVTDGKTYLEKGLADIYGELAAHGKSDSQAKKIADKAIKELVDMKALEELPTEESSDGAKAQWLSVAKSKIMAHLRLMGEIM